jgi:hypothetical protein
LPKGQVQEERITRKGKYRRIRESRGRTQLLNSMALTKTDLGIQSTNRTRCDEVLDETNAAVPSDLVDDAGIGSNCSPELEPPRTSASNTGS